MADVPGALDAAEGEASAAARILAALRARGLTLASCESITGGGIGWVLTSIAGSSSVFRGGLITYATDLKVSLAGVDEHYVAGHGVINETTARQMAAGARQLCRADVAVAATGTAGPEGQDGVPPGSVWLCVSAPERTLTRHVTLSGDRCLVRRATVRAALELLSDTLVEG
ncbi:CinA family protein [Propionibacterium cyclohexanicum]|uniref:CinA family protein n=1 Tax=Propionibacterium cyclohexanicum TaxID=64702 RepID=UPI001FE09755|nr:CinA family protein [Propionibacterium cyclohexanicum]